MNFIFIVFVITLCFPAYNSNETGASEPANMANPDEPTLTDPGDDETDFSTVDMLANEPVLPNPRDNETDYYRFREYWKAQKNWESFMESGYEKDVKSLNILKQLVFEGFNKQEQKRYSHWYAIYNSEALSHSIVVMNLNSAEPLDFSTVDMLANEPVLPNPRDNETDYYRFREYWKAQRSLESIVADYYNDKLKQFKQYDCVDKPIFINPNNDQNKQYQEYLHIRKTEPLKLVRFSLKQLEQYACWDMKSHLTDKNNNAKDSPLYKEYVELIKTWKQQAFKDFNRKEQYRFAYWYAIYNSEALCDSNIVTNLNSAEPLELSTVDLSLLPDPRGNKSDHNRFREYSQAKKSLKSTLEKLCNQILDTVSTVDIVERYAFWHFQDRNPIIPNPIESNKEDWKRYNEYMEALESDPLYLANRFYVNRNPIIPKPNKNNKEDWKRYNEYHEALTSVPLYLAKRFSVNQMNRYDYWRCAEIANKNFKTFLPFPEENSEDLKKYKTFVEKLNSFETELSKKFSKQELSRYSYWYDYLYKPRGQFFRYLMKSMGEARKE